MKRARAVSQGAVSLPQYGTRATKAVLLIGAVGFGLAGCSGMSGATYGTGETQEQALLDDVTGLLGAVPGKKKAPIDYSARAGLVLPPEGTPLPSPEAGKAQSFAASGNWPQDPDQLRKIYEERMSTMTEADREKLLEAIRRLPPEQRDSIIKNNTRSANFARQIKEPDYSKGPVDPAEQAAYDAEVKKRLALIRAQNEGETTKRTYLTQPPQRFTAVSPEIRSEMDKLQDGEQTDGPKKKNFFARIWPF